MVSRIELENRIKAEATRSWCFPSQAKVYAEVTPFLGGIQRVLNVYGLQGTGKTFLAHIMAKEGICDYVPSPDELVHTERTLIVDNAPFERTLARDLRSKMRKLELGQLLLITRFRIEDALPAFELPLTPEDLEVFRATLFRAFDLRLPERRALNLWEHLKLVGEPNGQ